MAALGTLRSMALCAQKNVIRHTVSSLSMCRWSPRDASANFSRRLVAWPTHFSTLKSLDEVAKCSHVLTVVKVLTVVCLCYGQNLFQVFSSDSSIALNFTQCVMRVLKCHNERHRVFVTGLGKSGAVAQRLASTLSSISISSQVIIISHSGRTTELLPLPDMFRKAGCCIMAVRKTRPAVQFHRGASSFRRQFATRSSNT
uniref:SIS domain-containing protein n=1 Tax=Hyaloperonospora arabidopsidis (strain Emoy2) TaxID=559515 RepID=M4BUW1_HYAAE